MIISLNGETRDLGDGACLDTAAALVDVSADDRGVAAALDGAVIPRREWASTPLTDGSQVEIVRAAAGG